MNISTVLLNSELLLLFVGFLIHPGDGDISNFWTCFLHKHQKGKKPNFWTRPLITLLPQFWSTQSILQFQLIHFNRLSTYFLRNQTYYALIISDWILLSQVPELGCLFETHPDKSLWDVVGCCGHVHENPCRSPPRHCLSGVL